MLINIFYEPGICNAMKLSLRRTRELKKSYELLATRLCSSLIAYSLPNKVQNV